MRDAYIAAAVAMCALLLRWLHSLHGLLRGTIETIALLAVAVVGYAVYYVVWFALEIRGPASELLSVCWNRHILRRAKDSCRALWGGKTFDFDDSHYADYLLQDEEEVDITWYDRIIARRLSFLCWPSSCFAPELAQELRLHHIGPNDVLLDIGSGVGLAMLTFRHLLPCKRVHGIELSERLFKVCHKNVECALAKEAGKDTWMRVEHADATTFEVPSDVTFAYMYNSFQDTLGSTGEEQHELFIGRIRESLAKKPRTLLLFLYDCEDVKEIYDGVEGFELKQEGEVGPDDLYVYACSHTNSTGKS